MKIIERICECLIGLIILTVAALVASSHFSAVLCRSLFDVLLFQVILFCLFVFIHSLCLRKLADDIYIIKNTLLGLWMIELKRIHVGKKGQRHKGTEAQSEEN